MTIRITKIDDEKGKRKILRVEGKLYRADAEIVEQMFEDFQKQNGREIEIDLTAISFLSEEGASALKRIEKRGARLTGLDFFIREIIETRK